MNKSFLKFPKTLPNDIEEYLIFFTKKFPKLVEDYEKLVNQYWNDPEGLDKYCQNLVRELWFGWKEIKQDYHKTKKENRTPEFLLNIDLRMQKLNCFKFWIINYALCEGPVHEYYSDLISSLVEKFMKDEDHETEIIERETTERLLLRGDYQDLYLKNALKGIEIYEDLKNFEKIDVLFKELEKTVFEKEDRKAYKLIDRIMQICLEEKTSPKLERFLKKIRGPLRASKIKNDLSYVYVIIISSIEFRKENLELRKELSAIKQKLEKTFDKAKKILSSEEFKQLRLAYEMLYKFKKFKDDFGAIDCEWLPFWFKELLPELESKINAPKGSCALGQGSIFYAFPWYFEKNLLEKVFTIDNTNFSNQP